MALTVNKLVTISWFKYLDLAQGRMKRTLLALQAEVFSLWLSIFPGKNDIIRIQRVQRTLMAKFDTDVQQSQGCLLAVHNRHSVLSSHFNLSCLFFCGRKCPVQWLRVKRMGSYSQSDYVLSDASDDSSLPLANAEWQTISVSVKLCRTHRSFNKILLFRGVFILPKWLQLCWQATTNASTWGHSQRQTKWNCIREFVTKNGGDFSCVHTDLNFMIVFYLMVVLDRKWINHVWLLNLFHAWLGFFKPFHNITYLLFLA